MHSKLYALANEIINCHGALMLSKPPDLNEQQRDYMRLIYYSAATLLEMMTEYPDVRTLSEQRLNQLPASEIRAPIIRLIGYSRMLLENPEMFSGSALAGKAHACVQKSHETGQQLLNMTNALLTYARLKSHTLDSYKTNFDATSPAYWLGEVYHLLGDDPVALNIHVYDRLPLVHGDEFRTYQIFNILIENALKFTHRGSVNVHMTQQDTYLQLRVSDTGIGIAPAAADKIFEPFFQADTHSPGLGLGLYLAKTLGELQGSTLRFESNAGGGSTFYFTLPTAEVS
ncbi:MAG: HAMP domain-containing sensor histidine kinase [Anaerolineae bacterium]